MRCPSCGLPVDEPERLDRCPSCGRALPTTTLGAQPASENSQGASESRASQSCKPGEGSSPSLAGQAPLVSSVPGSVAPGPNPASPPQMTDPIAPPDSPFTPYTGFVYPPSAQFGPYGAYAPAPGYPPSSYPQQPNASPPQRKRRTGLVVGIVIAVVVVVLGACAWSVVVTAQALHPPVQAAVPRQTPVNIYSNSFLSDAGGWANDSRCFQASDGYHVKGNFICYAPLGNLSDVDIRVQVQQISGSTHYGIGIAFRLLEHDTGSDFYGFEITSNGNWGLLKCSSGVCHTLIRARPSSAIQTGIGADNEIEVYAKGSHMDFFINAIAVGSIDDSSFVYGMVGLVGTNAGECVFTNLTIGQL